MGSGGVVEICVAFVNNNATDVTFTLPAGLIAIADDLKYQHGFLIQNTAIVLKAKRTTRVGVKFYCGNSQRLPSSGSKTYKLGPVSNSVLLQELCGLLKNKKTTKKEYADEDLYFQVSISIQNMIWSITDGDGLDKSTINAQLAAIPNR